MARRLSTVLTSPSPACPVPLLGFAAWSGTGKTTLLRQMLPLLTASGLRVGMVKHAHHDFDVDQPGKDSYELRHAGASQMLIASHRRYALMVEAPGETAPSLAEMLGHLDYSCLDLVLVEGFKHEAFTKIELHRPGLGHSLIYPQDANIIALASDAPPPADLTLPHLDLNDIPAMARYVVNLVRGCAQP